MTKGCDYAPNGWFCKSVKGIDSCNAYERHLKCYNPSNLEVYELVSYCTPVCVCVNYGNDIIYVYANGASVCSASTKSHVSRFLKRHGFNETSIHTVSSMVSSLPYDNFMRFETDPDTLSSNQITGGVWLASNLLPPSESTSYNGRLELYVPRFGFYNDFYYVEGGRKAGFKCFKRN